MRLRLWTLGVGTILGIAALAACTGGGGAGGGAASDEILVGEYGSLTGGHRDLRHLDPQRHRCSPSRSINAAGGVLGKKIRLDRRGRPVQARGGGDRRHQAHQPGPRRRDARRGGLVATRWPRRPSAQASQDPDDLALLDQPPGDARSATTSSASASSTPSRAR